MFPERKIGEVETVRFLSIPESSYSTGIEGASEGAIGGFGVD